MAVSIIVFLCLHIIFYMIGAFVVGDLMWLWQSMEWRSADRLFAVICYMTFMGVFIWQSSK